MTPKQITTIITAAAVALGGGGYLSIDPIKETFVTHVQLAEMVKVERRNSSFLIIDMLINQMKHERRAIGWRIADGHATPDDLDALEDIKNQLVTAQATRSELIGL